MLGRLTSIIAKELLNGQKLVVVCCGEICLSGDLTIHGMIPHKIKRRAATLARFKAYEDIPNPYDKIKRMAISDALKELEEKRNARSQVAYKCKK
ncbi:hypothetical protein MKW98_006989 [Papaver atlanticum]|uniref:60S ribosomal protein L13a n=1 Tax=Papaver atlanticum TaxID=357466 RepID=A0AAD4XL42_9MAGN|nr:hypothetical protein MKW98_006989 [Papaver atlanticum]